MIRTKTITVVCLLLVYSYTAAAEDVSSSWQIRRARTTDADKAGGYPEWEVTLEGSDDSPLLVIQEPEPEGKNIRGHILIGKRIMIKPKRGFQISLRYQTFCGLPHRRGNLEFAVLPLDYWNSLEDDPKTERIYPPSRDKILYHETIQSHVGDKDTTDWRSWQSSKYIARFVRRYKGQEVVLAIACGGFHGNVEWIKLDALKIYETEALNPTMRLFDALNLDYPGLEMVKSAIAQKDVELAKDELLKYFRRRESPRFYFDSRDRKKGYPDPGRHIKIAEDALQLRLIGQPSYPPHQFEGEIDWSANPVGDMEWPWQLNRHGFWHSMGIAYWATQEERFAKGFVEQLLHWIENNPPGTPYSWRTIEAGIRGKGWVTVYFRFLDSPSFTPNAHCAMLAAFLDHAEYLLPASHFHSRSNWGLIESNGLAYIGMIFPEFKAAGKWRDTAMSRMHAELKNQVYPDGAQIELSPSYHAGCIRLFRDVPRLAKLNNIEVPEGFNETIEKMYEFCMYLVKPDGTQPMWGDAWPGSYRGLLLEGAKLFDRSDMEYVATVGKSGTPPADTSHGFPYNGYQIMRSDWTEDARYMCFDVCKYGGGHSHYDTLSFVLYAYRKTLMPDSGSYLYYGPGRALFKSTKSHNTIVIDGKSQNTSPPIKRRWVSNEDFDYAVGAHTGYPDVTHERRIFFASKEYWIINDLVTGKGEHTADLYFHFSPTSLKTDSATIAAVTQNAGGPNITVLPVIDKDLGFAEERGWVSYRYTEKEPAPVVKYTRKGKLPLAFHTVLFPTPEGVAPKVEVKQLILKKSGAGESLSVPGECALRVKTEEFVDYFAVLYDPSPRSFTDAETGMTFNVDGEVLYVRVMDGKVVRRGDVGGRE